MPNIAFLNFANYCQRRKLEDIVGDMTRAEKKLGHTCSSILGTAPRRPTSASTSGELCPFHFLSPGHEQFSANADPSNLGNGRVAGGRQVARGGA
jgi:hypothetical protein